ncbi:T9SS type A sorting domain-containing protein [uncultured Draconibacterium sp.]|uniref:T9SS type A sorting domain-containing protein n=1 Tax=uncultured Draconibacterium sp. TaxID=1573823 RepID=UPI0025D687CC|nr:T9SS type A sorting domain-containing protein [uncultured Draconibacterium sp.]
MKQNYVEPSRTDFSLSEMKKWLFRCWCSGVTLLLLAIFTAPVSYGQIVTEGATVKANFGIDSDIYADTLTVYEGSYVYNTDDWFDTTLYSGSGSGVIDQTNAAALLQDVLADYNTSFELRMSVPRNTLNGGYLWIDGVYFRDWNSQGGFNDESVFTGGQDKNGGNPATWSLGTGGTPQKNDLVDVMGHMREDTNGDIYGIGAFTTISSDGNSHADFEFFRNQLDFSGTALTNLDDDAGHTAWEFGPKDVTQAGDLIVSIDFENGGTDPAASVRLWMSDATFAALSIAMPDSVDFTLTGEFDSGEDADGFGYAGIEATGSFAVAWAIVNVNDAVLGAPWGSLEAKAWYEEIQALQYAEFAINLTEIGLGSFGGDDACNKTLGSLMVKTRASASFTAELKDFAGPFLFGYELTTDVAVHNSEECQDEVSYDIDLTANVDTTFGNIITYHNTFEDADKFLGVIDDSLSHNIPANEMPKTIYVRASNPQDVECYVVDSFIIGFYPNPDLEVMNLDSCENGETGEKLFDLSTAVVSYGGSSPTYYSSYANANNGSPTISPLVTVSVGDSTFWVKTVSTNGCDSIADVLVTVYPNPVLEVMNLDSCGNGETGAKSFDLFTAVTDDGGGTLSYFASEADAITGTNSISPSVIVSVGDSTFWIKTINANYCEDIAEVQLTVYPNPVLEVTNLDSCENGETGAKSFDLSTAITDDGGGTVSYFASEADALAGTNSISPSVTVSVGDSTFWIKTINHNNCEDIADVLVTVYPNPICNTTAHAASNQFLYDGSAKVNTPDIVSYYWYTTDGTIGGGQGTDSIWGIEGSVGGIAYYVDLVDVNGCEVTCMVRISAPTYTTPPCTVDTEDATCDGASDGWAKIATVPTNYTNYLFEWYALPDDVTVISNDTMITGLDSGDYKLVITDTSLTVPQSVNCTGTVGDRDPVILTCPNDTTVTTCLTSAEIETAFDEWMARVTVIGSDSILTTDWDSVTYPDACGDTVTVTWTLHDECANPNTCSATFRLPAPADLVVTDPSDDDDNSSCDYDSQEQLSAAFDAWMSASLTAIQTELVGQGCDPQVTENDWDEVYPVLCEGDTITVTWTIEDLCDETTASATFGVAGVDDLVVTDPSDDDDNSSCDYDSQEQLSAAFDAWMSASLTAIQTELVGQGCDPQVTENDWDEVYPVLCEGDTITVTWTIEDLCDETTASATFGVAADTEKPTADNCPEPVDIGCDPEYVDWMPMDTVTWSDNCGVADKGVIEGTPTVSDDGCYYEVVHTHWAVDYCGNRETCEQTITWMINQYGGCETAFARLDEELSETNDTLGARCFLEDGYSRWGWTNLIQEGKTYYMPIYAGAAQCDESKGTHVGTAVVNFESEGVITVYYDLFDGWILSEAHIYAGEDMYPSMKNGKPTVAPGQYNIVYEGAQPLDGFDLELTGAPKSVFIIIHAVTCIPQCVCDIDYFNQQASLSGSVMIAQDKGKGNGKKKVETEDLDLLESEFKAFPNPFDEVVNFEFVPAVSGHAVLEIHNMLGQRIVRLLDKPVEAGELQRVEFRPETEISGMYLYKLDIDGDIRIGKLIYRNK